MDEFLRCTAAAGLAANAVLVAVPSMASGADTMEPYEPGLSNIDFYIGVDDISGVREELTVSSEVMLGYGILDRFSGYLGIALEGNGYLVEGATGVYFGLMGTPLETKHVDLDVYLTAGTGEPGSSCLRWTPGLELNFDLDPGYNVLLTPTLELLFHVGLQQTEPSDQARQVSTGFFTGFIATLP